MGAYSYESFPVMGRLIKHVSYFNDEHDEVLILEDTVIQVDTLTHVALIGNDHVQLEEQEYMVSIS